jgi:multidrug efflux pump subunit AcrA (membrane-fusion protein)
VSPAEYHEKSSAHDRAVSECDRDKQALAYAQTNLQTQQNTYDQANNAALFSRQSTYSRNQAIQSQGAAKSDVDRAQDAVDAAQQQLDAATANIPMPSWTCDLQGVLPADLSTAAAATASGAIATPQGGKPIAVAFVVDCSGSMLTCMPLMKQEMGEAINNLSADQRFGIFAETAAGIKNMSNDLVAATDENKSKAAAFIEPLQAGGGGQPDQALRVAASFGPDTVWLLTDGDLDTPSTLMQVVHSLPTSVRVNTAVFSRSPKETSKQLVLQIAADTNGICIDDTGKRLPLPPKTGEQPVPSLPKGHSIFDSP